MCTKLKHFHENLSRIVKGIKNLEKKVIKRNKIVFLKILNVSIRQKLSLKDNVLNPVRSIKMKFFRV